MLLVLLSTSTILHADTGTILVLGDSLSAAYGMRTEQGWVQLLQAKLKDSYRVINASVSGETTDGGLRALPKLLETHSPDIVIIELGANDGLRGFPIPIIQKNLTDIILKSQQYTDKILLLGVRIPPNYGQAYTEAFHSIYQSLSTRHQTELVPFIMSGIATESSLMQADKLHPNAAAQPLMLKLVWQALGPLIPLHSWRSKTASHVALTNTAAP